MALPNLGRLGVFATGAPGDGDGRAAQREALANPDIIASILANLQINSNRGVQEIEKLACEAANRWCNLNSTNKAACAPDMYWQALTAKVFPNGRSKPNANWTHRNWFFELCHRYRQYRKILSALNRANEANDEAKKRMELENSAYAAAMQDFAGEELERMEISRPPTTGGQTRCGITSIPPTTLSIPISPSLAIHTSRMAASTCQRGTGTTALLGRKRQGFKGW